MQVAEQSIAQTIILCYPEEEASIFVLNVGSHWPDYTVSLPRIITAM
jgi:hypothetical protein